MTKTQKQVADHYLKAIESAGLAELYAIAKKIERHYNNGTLSATDLSKLDGLVMEQIAKSTSLKP
jgi:hypothetical protein